MDNMREKTDRSIRLLKMFDMLQRGAGLNSRELQDRFGITAKSVQRDIEELRTYIADNYDQAEGENIEYSRIQKSYFWRNRSNIMLDEKEILLIAVILLESRGLTKDELQRLLEKILLQCSKTSEKKIRQLIQNEMFYYKATQNAKPMGDMLWKMMDAKQRQKCLRATYKRISEDYYEEIVKALRSQLGCSRQDLERHEAYYVFAVPSKEGYGVYLFQVKCINEPNSQELYLQKDPCYYSFESDSLMTFFDGKR